MINKAFSLCETHFDEFDDEFKEDFADVARRYDCKETELEKSLKEAEREWLKASDEYNKIAHR